MVGAIGREHGVRVGAPDAGHGHVVNVAPVVCLLEGQLCLCGQSGKMEI